MELTPLNRMAAAVVLVALWTGVSALIFRRDKVPSVAWRLAFALATATTACVLAWIFWSVPRASASDIAPIWAGARALLHGENPYGAVGPGRAFDTNYPLIYPLTAVLALTPLVLVSLRSADLIFVSVGFGLFAWAITRRGHLTPAVVALVSLPGLMALQTSQWSLLLTGAALLPPLGVVLVAKPTIGLALFGAFPNWRTAIGSAIFLGVTILIWPTWIADWRSGLVTAPHVVAPITRVGGPLMLLALLKWKRADARLLVGLACVPHTTALYETIPLFLIAETWGQAWSLWALALLAYLGQWATGPYPSVEAHWASGAQWIVALLYVPCLAMVLTRPNVWSGADSWGALIPRRIRAWRTAATITEARRAA